MQKISIQADYLKLLALVAMTVDHANKIIAHTEWLSSTIGRMAFPIFAYLIISNFCTYHPFKKYVVRLGFFCIFTELILRCFTPDFPNVLSTFLWGIIYIEASEFICQKTKSSLWQGYWMSFLFFLLLPLILSADYSLLGFFFLMALYVYHKFPSKLNYGAVLITGVGMNFFSVWAVIFTLLTLIGLLSGIKIVKGLRLIKWWGFYFYYPLHLLLIYCLKELM